MFETPNALLQRHRAPWLSLGASHRGCVDGLFLLGLAGWAEVGGGLDERVLARANRGADDPARTASAVSRVGVTDDALFPGAPTVALGVHHGFAGQVVGVEPATVTLKVANLDLVASRRLGPVELHLGGRSRDLRALDPAAAVPFATEPLRLGTIWERLRPMAALSFAPGLYLRTRLLFDLSSVTRIEEEGARVEIQRTWGVRYHPLRRAHIELLVRHIEGEAHR